MESESLSDELYLETPGQTIIDADLNAIKRAVKKLIDRIKKATIRHGKENMACVETPYILNEIDEIFGSKLI